MTWVEVCLSNAFRYWMPTWNSRHLGHVRRNVASEGDWLVTRWTFVHMWVMLGIISCWEKGFLFTWIMSEILYHIYVDNVRFSPRVSVISITWWNKNLTLCLKSRVLMGQSKIGRLSDEIVSMCRACHKLGMNQDEADCSVIS